MPLVVVPIRTEVALRRTPVVNHSTRKLDMLRALGADDVVDFTQENFTQRGVRYDLIIDVPGNHPFSACRRALAPDGRYVLIGHDHYGASGKRVFGLIPGLEHAGFARNGSMHRNTYIHSPLLLAPALQLKADPRIFFAGQITGVEGYVESIAMGLLAGINAARCGAGLETSVPPAITITGALAAYITDPANAKDFQPAARMSDVPQPSRAAGCHGWSSASRQRWRQFAIL